MHRRAGVALCTHSISKRNQHLSKAPTACITIGHRDTQASERGGKMEICKKLQTDEVSGWKSWVNMRVVGQRHMGCLSLRPEMSWWNWVTWCGQTPTVHAVLAVISCFEKYYLNRPLIKSNWSFGLCHQHLIFVTRSGNRGDANGQLLPKIFQNLYSCKVQVYLEILMYVYIYIYTFEVIRRYILLVWQTSQLHKPRKQVLWQEFWIFRGKTTSTVFLPTYR